MKSQLTMAAVLLALSFAVAAHSQESDIAKDQVEKLQGVWQVVKFVDHGLKPAPQEELKGHTFEFKGKIVTQRKGKDGRGRSGTFTINISKYPKWMDIDFGMASEGIYKVNGDELSLCFAAGARGGKTTPRPTEFKASDNPPHSLLVLKRVKN